MYRSKKLLLCQFKTLHYDVFVLYKKIYIYSMKMGHLIGSKEIYNYK